LQSQYTDFLEIIKPTSIEDCLSLSTPQAKEIRKGVLDKFGVKGMGVGLPLFERLIPNSIGSSDPSSLQAIRKFPSVNLLVFFEKEDVVLSACGFNDIVDAYEQCSPFSIYMTNTALDFVVCFSCESTLIVCGTAESWYESST